MPPKVNLNATLRLKDELTNQLKRTEKSVGASLKSMVKRFLAVGAAGAVFVKLADDMVVLRNRLKAVTETSGEAESALKGLSEISKETRSSIASNAQAFQRFTIATDEMGLSQKKVLDLVRQVNLAVKLSGTTAKEANAGMIQFAQGLSAGALRGDELRSVLEQMPVVAKVIAQGFNIPINQLKRLGEQGLLTAEGIVKAFDEADASLTQKFKKLVPTVGDSLGVAFDQFKLLIGELNDMFGVTSAIATLLRALTEVISDANKLIKSRNALSELDKLRTAKDRPPRITTGSNIIDLFLNLRRNQQAGDTQVGSSEFGFPTFRSVPHVPITREQKRADRARRRNEAAAFETGFTAPFGQRAGEFDSRPGTGLPIRTGPDLSIGRPQQFEGDVDDLIESALSSRVKGNLEIPKGGRGVGALRQGKFDEVNFFDLVSQDFGEQQGIESLDSQLELIEKIRIGFESLGKELTKTTEKTSVWKSALSRVKDEFSELNIAVSVVGGTADAFISNVTTGLAGITAGTLTAKEAFAEMARSILRDLQNIIVSALVAKALGALVGSFAGGKSAISKEGLTASQAVGIGGAQRLSGAAVGIGAAPASSFQPKIPLSQLPDLPAGFAHGGFVKPGQIQPAILHGGKFGEAIIPLDNPVSQGSGGGTTIVYNIQAIDVEDFDRKILASVARSDGEITAIVSARARNSRVHRTSFGIG